METNRHTINDAGIGNLIELLRRNWSRTHVESNTGSNRRSTSSTNENAFASKHYIRVEPVVSFIAIAVWPILTKKRTCQFASKPTIGLGRAGTPAVIFSNAIVTSI